MYQEIRPAKELSHLVQSFWTFSQGESPEGFKVLPDSCIDLVFDITQGAAVVSGVMSKYQLRVLKAQSNLVGVRFKAEHFGMLSRVPLIDTRNLRVELSQVDSNFRSTILGRLNERSQTTENIALMEIYIKQIWSQANHEQDQLVLSVAKKIRALKGVINAKGIATSYYISLRQLERRFKKAIGLSLKEFASVVRFGNAKRAISRFREKSLLAIALEAGFYDHAHMSYEFRRIASENPSAFR